MKPKHNPRCFQAKRRSFHNQDRLGRGLSASTVVTRDKRATHPRRRRTTDQDVGEDSPWLSVEAVTPQQQVTHFRRTPTKPNTSPVADLAYTRMLIDRSSWDSPNIKSHLTVVRAWWHFSGSAPTRRPWRGGAQGPTTKIKYTCPRRATPALKRRSHDVKKIFYEISHPGAGWLAHTGSTKRARTERPSTTWRFERHACSFDTRPLSRLTSLQA